MRSRRNRVRLVSSQPVTSVPSTSTRPDVGRSKPATQARNVDLPEPDGPMMAVKVPRSNARSMPPRAATAPAPVPYRLVRPSTARAGLSLVMPTTLGNGTGTYR